MKNFTKWSSHEYPLPVRLVMLAIPGFLIVLIIPYLLLVTLPRLDDVLGFPQIRPGMVNPVSGAVLVALGLFFAWWSIRDQLFKASGTPLPVMPTQKMLIRGPFRLCRNPMTLGTILAYFGLVVWVGSISSILLAIVIAGMLILYLKLVEERELEMRFGQDYLNYKQRTPFLIPLIFRNRDR